MGKNSPEPWSIHDSNVYFSICDAGSNLVADTGLSSCQGHIELGEANARRIVACVNACRGVDNNQLMVTSVSGAIIMLRQAEQQRDELLAALEAFTAAQDAKRAAQGNGAGTISAAISDLIVAEEKARAAIASVKGGAA